MENIHGPVINYPKPDSISKKAVVPEKIVLEKKTSILEWISNLPWWAWLLMGIGMIFIIGTIVHNENEKRNVDPITAGPPQVPGGVTDVSAHSRINAIAQSRFPGARLNIKNIRRGHLSGKGTVSYADGTKPKKINLKNVAAYAGEITINGTDEHTIYFLQGCGNDTAVSHMSGDELVFTPDVVINPDGSESSIPVVPEEVPVIETVTENQPTVPTPIPVPGSEFHQHVEKGMETVKGFLDGNDAKHRVSLKITHDSFEVVIENKYDQKKSTGPQASIEK